MDAPDQVTGQAICVYDFELVCPRPCQSCPFYVSHPYVVPYCCAFDGCIACGTCPRVISRGKKKV